MKFIEEQKPKGYPGKCTMNVRGNKYTWRFWFWWDYKVCMNFMLKFPKIYLFFKYDIKKIRYKTVIINHKMCVKDKWLFWKEPKDTGARFV